MQKREGFTLLETVVAVVLLAIVVAFTFSAMQNSQTYIISSKIYAEVAYKALEDVNRGIPIDETTPDYIRKTTIIEDGNLKIVKSTVISNSDKDNLDPVEVTFYRYKE